jgi:hypothetical protein
LAGKMWSRWRESFDAAERTEWKRLEPSFSCQHQRSPSVCWRQSRGRSYESDLEVIYNQNWYTAKCEHVNYILLRFYWPFGAVRSDNFDLSFQTKNFRSICMT